MASARRASPPLATGSGLPGPGPLTAADTGREFQLGADAADAAKIMLALFDILRTNCTRKVE